MKPSLKKWIKSQSCAACGESKVDACHIRSKGAGGPDEEWNLYPGCRSCHQEQHRIGMATFIHRHKNVRAYFESKGWTVETIVGKQKLCHGKLVDTEPEIHGESFK